MGAAAMVFARLWLAIRTIALWGRSGAVALAGPVRRILSLSFVTQFLPRLWGVLRKHGPTAATVASLWYTLKGELLSEDDALAIAREKGVDELMKGRHPEDVLSKLIDEVPNVPAEHKEILKKALKEGSNKVKAAPAQGAPQTQTTAITVMPEVLNKPVRAGDADALIAQQVAGLNGAALGKQTMLNGSVQVSVDSSVVAAVAKDLKDMAAEGARLAINYNIPDVPAFLRDMVRYVTRYRNYLGLGA